MANGEGEGGKPTGEKAAENQITVNVDTAGIVDALNGIKQDIAELKADKNKGEGKGNDDGIFF